MSRSGRATCLSRLLERTPDDRMHIVPRLVSSDPELPVALGGAGAADRPGQAAGTLIAFYRSVGRPSGGELRVVQEAASLVSAQVELSVVRDQEERLAQAELRALRAQISPHFIYNALAAVAGDIHARPEEARELLIDFAEFTRYLFRDGRSYVTLAEELDHVERYLRLEQARFRDKLHVTFDVPSRHPGRRRAGDVDPAAGRERRPPRRRAARAAAAGSRSRRGSRGGDIELRVRDDGIGIDPERRPGAAGRNRQGNRPLERRRSAAGDVRRALRAADRRRDRATGRRS